ncbi:hypothetical protein GCM10018790_74460 [Kitasatospora xanthocidica]|nr:hypothetical protein GCM10018790_74460 [Kitasatospora xanthocidica]
MVALWVCRKKANTASDTAATQAAGRVQEFDRPAAGSSPGSSGPDCRAHRVRPNSRTAMAPR